MNLSLSQASSWDRPKLFIPTGSFELYTVHCINCHDNIPKEFEGEVLQDECPSCCPTNSIKALKAQTLIVYYTNDDSYLHCSRPSGSILSPDRNIVILQCVMLSSQSVKSTAIINRPPLHPKNNNSQKFIFGNWTKLEWLWKNRQFKQKASVCV